eukprot:1307100-Prymnesium_polylepis.1
MQQTAHSRPSSVTSPRATAWRLLSAARRSAESAALSTCGFPGWLDGAATMCGRKRDLASQERSAGVRLVVARSIAASEAPLAPLATGRIPLAARRATLLPPRCIAAGADGPAEHRGPAAFPRHAIELLASKCLNEVA